MLDDSFVVFKGHLVVISSRKPTATVFYNYRGRQRDQM